MSEPTRGSMEWLRQYHEGPPQEMTSLVEIKAKLDAIAKRQDQDREAISTWIAAERIHLDLRLDALDGRLKGLGDGLGSELGELRKTIKNRCDYLENNVEGLRTTTMRGMEVLNRRPAKPKRKRTK